MSVVDTITFNLELNIERAWDNARRLELLLYRSIALLGRMGLPENIDQAIAKVQRLIMTVRLLHTAAIALEGASGPIGWALALVGVASALLSTGDLIYDVTRGL
jgi:hypothetical protein